MVLQQLMGSQREQIKFYGDSDLREKFERVLELQGLSLSEGIGRLMSFLTAMPAQLVPIVLAQAPGDAARALAAHILATGPIAPPKRRLGVKLSEGGASQVRDAQDPPASTSRRRGTRRRNNHS